MENKVGQTKDVGFQFGIRKSFLVSAEKVWKFVFSENESKIWLGKFKNQNSKLIVKSIAKGIKRGEMDPHIWVDPINVKQIARNIVPEKPTK